MELSSKSLSFSSVLGLSLVLASLNLQAAEQALTTTVDLSKCSANQDYLDGNAACAGRYAGKYRITAHYSDFAKAFPVASVTNSSFQAGDVDLPSQLKLQCQYTYSFPVGSVTFDVTDLQTKKMVTTEPQTLVATKSFDGQVLAWGSHKIEDCQAPKTDGALDFSVNPESFKPVSIVEKSRSRFVHLYLKINTFKLSGQIVAPAYPPQTQVFAFDSAQQVSPLLSWTAIDSAKDDNIGGKFAPSTRRTQGEVDLKFSP